MIRANPFFLLILLPFFFVINKSNGQRSSISGTITEEKSGETIIGSTIALYADSSQHLQKPIRGTYSNKFGFYSLPNIPDGIYYMVISGVGYEVYKEKIKISNPDDLRKDIRLRQMDINLSEVTIEEKRMENPVNTISVIKVNPNFINKMPALGGEKDVFRTLQLLPGVKQSSEISSGLYVRGGSPDQNLVLLDGVIVYNPSHLGGFLSTFNSDALRDIRLLKGAFPAEYGGRISSVIDMTMREGTKEKITGAGGISLINSRLTVEGPINKDATFMISGRRMYLDVIMMLIPRADESPTYYFYDLNAKLNYKISENDKLFLSGYFGRDVFHAAEDESNFGFYWGNSTGNLRWMHIISSNLFTNFSLIYSDYKFDNKIMQTDNSQNLFNSVSQIKDYTLRAEAQYFPNENHLLKSGIELINHDLSWFSSFGLDRNEIIDFDEVEQQRSLDLSLYLQDEWKISPLLNANLGGRFSYFEKGNHFNFEPRLSAKYSVTDKISLNGSFDIVNQYMHLVSRNDIPLPTDLWFTSNDQIKPGRSIQGSLGIETSFNNAEYFASGEIYYKDMGNLYEYKDSASFTPGISLSNQLTAGKGKAFGLELFLNKKFGKLTGWIGYSLSWIKYYFDELNGGKPFYPRHDKRHDISIVLSYELSKKIEIGASWVYSTGQSYTMPTGSFSFYDVGGYSFNGMPGRLYNGYYYSERNAHRLPAFHKLDLNVMYNYEWFKLPFQLSINIYNVYNHLNPFIWYIKNETDKDTKQTRKVIKQFTLFPCIPTIGLSFKF